MISGMILVMNVASAASLFALGCAFVWRAFPAVREWPVSALVAIAGPNLIVAIVLAQQAVWRADGNGGDEGGILGYSGVGTLAIRAALVVVSVAMTRRVLFGAILTDTDRKRVRDP